MLNDTVLIQSKIKNYFSLVAQNSPLRRMLHVLDVHSADMIQDPKRSMQRICKFLKVECDEKYLQDCASIVFQSPSKTRSNVMWTEELKQEVYTRMKKYPFLSRYSFSSN